MKATPLTTSVAHLILIIYIVYAVFFIPIGGALVSGAVGLLVFGFVSSYEISVALTILTGVLFSLFVRSDEGFTDKTDKVVEQIKSITGSSTKNKSKEPGGVFASTYVEGFENVDGSGSLVQVESPISKPASATAPSPTVQTISMPSVVPSGTVGTAMKDGVAPEPKKGNVSAGFQSGSASEPDGLFKLGVIPEDVKGGIHIDQGTTVMNALNSLKPDQIQQMSMDTQKLIDTQKSLMSMLSTVKPMMQDGKQMMDTFQQMFGSSGAMPNPL